MGGGGVVSVTARVGNRIYEKIPRNRLGIGSGIPRKKVLIRGIPRFTE